MRTNIGDTTDARKIDDSNDFQEQEAMIELPVLPVVGSVSGSVGDRSAGSSGPVYWRSEAQLSGSPEFDHFTEGEFIPGADDAPSGASRRQFLQVMGASMALAGLTACRKPVENILPFAQMPEDLIPGVPVNYATAMPFRGTIRPVLVESSDGRPTKIEGNPEHPDSEGTASIFEQGSLLNLYDPDRSQFVLKSGARTNWSEFVSLATQLASDTRIAVVSAPSTSQTLANLRSQLEARFSALRWIEYSSTGDDHSIAASESLFGQSLRPRYTVSAATTIVSLDADFLGTTDRDTLAHTAGFSDGRDIDRNNDSALNSHGEMSRIYVVESRYSITGGMADNRLRLRASEIPAFAAALSTALGVGVSGGEIFEDHEYIQAMTEDLRAAGSTGLVIAGENQRADVHAIAAAINDHLGAVGTTVSYLDTQESGASSRLSNLRELVDEINAGNVDVLVMIGCNPAYDAPADLNFAQAVSQVSESVHVGLHVDETAAVSRWHIPATHYLEAWGDGRAADGTRSVIQPLIAPLYADAHSDLEIIGLLATQQDTPGYDHVRSTWQALISGSFEATWLRVLHDGFLPDSQYRSVRPNLRRAAIPSAVSSSKDAGFEILFHLDGTVLDGSYANNAWMQELPDSTTKVVWDNVAIMSPATAETLGVKMKLKKGQYFTDRISISVDGRTADLPVWVQPGVADSTIGLTLGYGRTIESTRPERKTNIFDLDDYTDVYGKGAIGTGIGVNVAGLRTAASFNLATGAEVVRSDSGYLVVSTQDHGALPVDGFEVERRGLFRAATAREYAENPDFVKEMEPESPREAWEDYPTLWQKNHPTKTEEFKNNDYNQYQWAMVIDLNTCTGCNACVVACQAENSIPVVGKAEVSIGRELHWIRVDRYFVSGDDGTYDEPRMVVQPIPCMHCENAPCEQVCPVAATVHSPDGTNQMIYNRCIGTRYCANNCPYKVRRFNFYNWTKTLPTSIQMVNNPNVTVRSRGIMEKCSFCIQRIREVNKKMSVEKRAMEVDEIQTACQQSCPAKAISFGDLEAAASKVNEKRRSRRRYEMLAELNVLPRTSYLARVRNPNPGLGHDS